MRANLENSFLGKHVFGRHVTHDHVIASSAGSRGPHGETSALRARDLGTYHIEMHPDTSRPVETIERALNDFYGRRVRGALHADGARENRRAALPMA
eukprot:14570-Alexandrium_andersonii.AAC.2